MALVSSSCRPSLGGRSGWHFPAPPPSVAVRGDVAAEVADGRWARRASSSPAAGCRQRRRHRRRHGAGLRLHLGWVRLRPVERPGHALRKGCASRGGLWDRLSPGGGHPSLFYRWTRPFSQRQRRAPLLSDSRGAAASPSHSPLCVVSRRLIPDGSETMGREVTSLLQWHLRRVAALTSTMSIETPTPVGQAWRRRPPDGLLLSPLFGRPRAFQSEPSRLDRPSLKPRLAS